jgi:hypothetical protein
MRRVILAAGLFAAFGLSACDSSKTDDVAAATPAPPRDMARSQQMYQGQEMISKIGVASIKVAKPGVLDVMVDGGVDGPGYKNATLLPRINAFPPKDGVYDVDVVADKPASAGAAASTPVEIKTGWSPYPADHLKGVRFFSKTNKVVAMLPAG